MNAQQPTQLLIQVNTGSSIEISAEADDLLDAQPEFSAIRVWSPMDPTSAASNCGYAIEDGSPEHWASDRRNPPGYGTWVYVESFVGPGYNDTGGPEYAPYDVTSFNALPDSFLRRVCKKVWDSLFHCFRKKEPPADPDVDIPDVDITYPPSFSPARELLRKRQGASRPQTQRW